jgi:hypothetical protein
MSRRRPTLAARARIVTALAASSGSVLDVLGLEW